MTPPFADLKASDIMQDRVVTVESSDTLRDALKLMTEHHVSGLPVIKPGNRCVGVISASDILNVEQEHSPEPGEETHDYARYFNPETGEWEEILASAFALEEHGNLPVGDIMTTNIIAVAPETTLPGVAATMVKRDVHRVLVLDDGQTLLGLISSVDFVRLVAEGAA
ncbi:MAG: HPP family protein [Planctomycetaceae bacterium]